MSANNKKQDLRLLLSAKSTEELKKLLSSDFAQDRIDATHISTILEVIEERENNGEEKERKTRDAWNEFRTYCTEMRSQEEPEADRIEKPNRDHQHKTEHCQKSRKHTTIWRVGLVAAVLGVLLCGTAFGGNLFRAIADWTEEVFYFLTGQEQAENERSEVFNTLRSSVALRTDMPCVPQWAPNGTQEYGTLNLAMRNDRCHIGAGYSIGERMFSVRVIIHPMTLDSLAGTYQKDATICEEYMANGIIHYIVGNNENLSAMWINGNVEGHIQGDLTVDELKLMIDSIYEE